MTLFVQSLVAGSLIGLVYALLSAGFSMIWGVARVINLVHPVLSVLSAYIAYWAAGRGSAVFATTLVLLGPASFLLGQLFYRWVVVPAARRSHDINLTSMILTFGLAVALENALAMAWGPGPRALSLPLQGRSLFLGPVGIPLPSLIAAGASLVILAGMIWFLHGTLSGRAVRAVWQDPEGAALSGIDLHRVTGLTYGIAFASAAAGGVAMALIYTFSPATQLTWLVYVFLVTIVGGVGSLSGAVVAGLAVGNLSSLTGLVVPYSWTPLVLFCSLIALLLWRPEGLVQR